MRSLLISIVFIALNLSHVAMALPTAEERVSKTVGQLEGLYPAIQMMHWLLKQAETKSPTYINYAVWRVWNWNMHNPSWQLNKEIDSAAFILAMQKLESLEEDSTNAYRGCPELRGVKKGSIDEFFFKDKLKKVPEIKAKRKEIDKIFKDQLAMPSYSQVLKTIEKLLEYMEAEIADGRYVNRSLEIYKDAKKQTLKRSLHFFGTLFFIPSIVGKSSEVSGAESLQQALDNLGKVREYLIQLQAGEAALKITGEYIKNILFEKQNLKPRSFMDKLLNRNHYNNPYGHVNNVFFEQYMKAVAQQLESSSCLASLVQLK